MDGLLGEEVREIQFLIAEHCIDLIPPSRSGTSTITSIDGNADSSNANNNSSKRSFVNNPPSQQSNDLAHAIALVLAQAAWCSLIDIAAALQENRFLTPMGTSKNILTEDNLRTELKRLVTHGMVRYDTRNGRYAIDVVSGTLRILFPLMSQAVIAQYGPVCEIALQILYEHHDLPVHVLTNLVYDANPQLGHGVVDRVIKTLKDEDWIVQVSSTTGVPQQQQSATSATGKTGADAAVAPLNIGTNAIAAATTNSNNNSNNSSGLNASFGINYAKFLAVYRSILVIKYGTESMSPAQRSVISLLAHSRIKEKEIQIASSADENSSAKLPNFGAEIPVETITRRLVQTNSVSSMDHANALVRSLTNDGLKPIVQQLMTSNNASGDNKKGNTATSNNNNTADLLFADAAVTNNNNNNNNSSSVLRFHYDNVTHRIRRALMCSEIRARFGLLGQRIVKILFDHHALEDKNIAEEGLISLQDLHQLLLAMQGQGILCLQELMKTPGGGMSVTAQIAANSGPDRSMKQSIFLWKLQERTLLSLVRRRVAKSVCALRVRMRSEYQNHFGGDNGAGASSNSISDNTNQGPRAPDNTARNGNSSSTAWRFSVIQEHLTKTLVALYEELALSTFC